ncbi:gamma-glutamyl-gamma-aminobutyrate hydrolase family protein [Pseudomonas chlororaphis]|uniref:gamma-glutamyl-gamma-aminobutyrate hydrolase family protein n=1 Tax=Pseudomonas chlororaphis TaxID=587753 RepID=UPI000F569FEC|nr:gamma-glutamyl-gamma-aminobutyrate hydrolase family protein [Pseudomonas chlororaphis]AZD82632.1 peptidase C26 [Pseudomonas chlororaphis subsp. aurantiaca]
MKRLGITLRTCNPQAYHEPRDGLARDWYRFFAELGCGNQWLLLPHLGEDTVAYARDQGVQGVIFSGGDDLGSDPLRDQSEQALLAHCVAERLPVLGVCRGLQLIHSFFGGRLADAERDVHVAQRHLITLLAADELPWLPGQAASRSVNSFHGKQLLDPLPAALRPWALDAAGTCEALVHTSLKVAGIMWHPEREAALDEADRQLCQWLFE